MSFSLIKYPQAGGGGSGTVVSGTENQLAFYPANGTAVAGLTIAPNEVLSSDADGLPVGSGLSVSDLLSYQKMLRTATILN